MEKGRKCPNCGYVSTKNEEICPNCDCFHPTSEELTQEQAAAKQDTSQQESVSDAPVTPPLTKKTETVINKFVPDSEIPPIAEPQNNPESATELPVEIPREKKPFNKKWLAILAALLLIVAGGYFYTRYQANEAAKKDAAEVKAAALLEINFEKLYLNEERVFLSESYQSERLSELLKESEAKQDNPYMKKLAPIQADLLKRSKLQEAVNDLFTEPAVTGNQLDKNAIVKEGELTLPTKVAQPADDFEKLINQGIEAAESQLSANEQTKGLMTVIFATEPTDKATRKLYDEAKSSVAKLKNPTIKKHYEEQLVKVDAFLKVKEEQARVKKEEEERLIAAAKAEAETKKTSNAPASQTGERRGISLPNEASGTQSGDWSWATGVQDKVIGVCIERGYVVQGGYELRPRTIINGEAYYDLFATSTQSSLLKSRANSELPIYLVTINAKTGWFKGEGPN